MAEDITNTEYQKVHNNLDSFIFETAINVLDEEANSILLQKSYIDDSFIKAVKLISFHSGNIFLSGIGKSSIIAKKISATMASIGISSFYIDPVNALHGDIGRIKSSDIIIILSYSGQTKELKDFIYSLKNREVLIISITSNEKSFLAVNSDIVIKINILKEACPLNLCPSSSTTAMLSIGDAISFCVMNIKGVREVDFSKNHPAGALGKKTNLRVCDIMRKNDLIPKINIDLKVYDAINIMTSFKTGAVCIVDDNDYLKGYFTDSDLRKLISLRENLDKKIKDVMNNNPFTITADKFIGEALALLSSKGFDNMPVVDYSNKLIGFLDERDLMIL